MRGYAWRETSIGPPQDWPQSLRSMVRILLTSRYQMWSGKLPVVTPVQSDDVPRASREEVILVVEDNAEVRTYSTMVLSELGYQVLEAGDAESALAILQTPARVDLLFTDVVLPGKSGRALSDAAREVRPDLRVLYTTGYSRSHRPSRASRLRRAAHQQAVHVRATRPANPGSARQAVNRSRFLIGTHEHAAIALMHMWRRSIILQCQKNVRHLPLLPRCAGGSASQRC